MISAKVKSAERQPQFAPLSIARMLWKRRLLLLSTATGLACAAGIVVHKIPNVYKADAVILVDAQKIPEKFVSSTVQVSLQDSLATTSQQVLSVSRVQKIIEDFNLYPEERKRKAPEEVVEKMRKDLTVTLERAWSGGRPGAFRVSYEGRSPEVVAGVVNQIAGLFIGENLRTREQRAEGTSDFIESQLKQAKQSLEEQEANLSRYKLRWAGELPQQEGALLNTLTRMQTELSNNQDAINRAQQNKLMLESTLRIAESTAASIERTIRTPAPAPVMTVITNSPASSPDLTRPALPRSSDALEAQLNVLLARYREEHPEVKRLRAELTRVRAAEQAAARQLQAKQSAAQETKEESAALPLPTAHNPASAQLIADLNRERERVATVKTQIELANHEIESRSAEQQRILRSISEYGARVEKLPIREQEMSSLTRDYETSKQNYRSLLDKKISAEMATEMERQQQSERFSLVERARVPVKPIRPKREIFYAGGLLLAIGIAMVLALGLELQRNVFLGEWELPEDVPVLGRISVIDSGMPGPRPGSMAAAVARSLVLIGLLLAGAAGLHLGLGGTL